MISINIHEIEKRRFFLDNPLIGLIDIFKLCKLLQMIDDVRDDLQPSVKHLLNHQIKPCSFPLRKHRVNKGQLSEMGLKDFLYCLKFWRLG